MSARSVEKQFIILGADGIGVGCVFGDELKPDEYGATPQAVNIYMRDRWIAKAWYGAKEFIPPPDVQQAKGAANPEPREDKPSDV